MKKLIVALVMLFLMAGIVNAGVLEDVVKFVSEHPMKTGIFYDAVDKEPEGLIQTVIKEDFLYKNVDLDLGIASNDEDLFNVDINNYKTILGGLSYNIPVGTKYALSIGLNAGLDRIEGFKSLGETTYGGNISFKW